MSHCCWCYRCDERYGAYTDLSIWDMHTRLNLCPDCGNKRCPRATDHTLECTGSNEPGQPGSIYVKVGQ